VFSFIFLLFVLNWGRIADTLERTKFKEIFTTQRDGGGNPPTAPVTPASRVETPSAPSKGTDVAPGAGARNGGTIEVKPASSTTAPTTAPTTATPTAPTTAATTRSGDPSTTLPADRGPVAAAERVVSAAQSAKPRQATLYFVKIDDDGIIVRQEVTRMVPTSDSPLTDALSALVRGPNEDELRKHLVSLIPVGTKLLGVRVQGTTAIVNLDEAFMYNHYGIEGYAGQLKQIVYTATAFPSVHDVQILIDGERHDYLGGEGVYIGKPLSRNSF
jgi:hypothetical protein